MRTDRHWLHQKLVAFARANGLKAAAREFGCSRNTVRKWLRRYQPGKPSALAEHSRRPKHSPHQISNGLEGQIVKLRQQTGFGAQRLQHEFLLPCSHNAIARVLRQHQLVRARKKKPATKKQLRSVKRHWKLFGQLSTDTKYLQDIPHYWPQMTHLRLPRFQYTAREPVSGACFTGYADELSKSYATFLAEQLSVHLAGHGVDLSALVWQTDNGCEFLENQQEQGLPSTVRALGCDHRYIPPKRYTWQSDVETVHRLVEDEFFDRETFTGPADFWAKVTTYWHYFNLVRPNRGKEWQSPLQILQRQAPALAGALLNWRPLNLTKRHHFYLPKPNHRGHDVPSFPLIRPRQTIMNLSAPNPASCSRRLFIRKAAALSVGALASAKLRSHAADGQKKYRAAIIGHTGAGNYGHGLDMLFSGRPGIEVVAMADPDAGGRAKTASRTGAARQYADYREMLSKEKPDLVSVAPRWTLEHHAMGLAALRAGAHLFMEKPFTHTLAEADELLSLANKGRLKIAVAHQMRLAPNVLFLKQKMDGGLIGDLLEIRAHGKQDHRAGGEDLLVLGVHLFDLIRFFAGDAQWCTARVLQNGQTVTLRNSRPATEGIGLVLGDELFAQFAFAKGVNATFTSRKTNQQAAGHWGIELVGSKGAARILADICPRIFVRSHGDWRTTEWKPVEGDPTANWSDAERSVQRANDRVVDDWLEAIESNRDPACSGFAGMKAVEMVHAIFAAGLSHQRVELPLKNRTHPLARP